MSLTKSQARNLARLKEVGSVAYTKGKADKKGFHTTALFSLVDLDLVELTTTVDADWFKSVNTFKPAAS